MAASNKSIVRRLLEEGLNKWDLDVVDETVATDVVVHYPSYSSPVYGRERYKQTLAVYRAPFPDAEFTIEDLMAEGDKAVVRWTMHATDTGEFWGIPPTGNRVTMAGITVYRMSGGKVAEIWVNWDELGLVQQLGADLRPTIGSS